MSQSTATQVHERLLEHHGFVRRLARGLVLDAAEAEDAGQDTWLAVMKRPPQEVRQPRPWLAGAVRKVVQSRPRTDYRRKRRERVAAQPESVPADSDLLLRAELQRRVNRCSSSSHSLNGERWAPHAFIAHSPER